MERRCLSAWVMIIRDERLVCGKFAPWSEGPKMAQYGSALRLTVLRMGIAIVKPLAITYAIALNVPQFPCFEMPPFLISSLADQTKTEFASR